MRAKPMTMFGREAGLDLEEVARIDDARDDAADVVGLLGLDRNDVAQRGIRIDVARRLAAAADPPGCWTAESSGACWHRKTASSSSSATKWIDARVGHVRVGAAQLLGRHVFAGDLLDHLRSGDEHLGLARLDDEVGERRAVSRAARAGAADQRDLRHSAGQHHVGVEDLAVAREASIPSCTRAPPESLMKTNGRAGLERHAP